MLMKFKICATLIFITFSAFAEVNELYQFVLQTKWQDFSTEVPTKAKDGEVPTQNILKKNLATIYLSHNIAKGHLKGKLHLSDFKQFKMQLLNPILSMHGIPIIYAVGIPQKGIVLEADGSGYIKKVRSVKEWKGKALQNSPDILEKIKFKVASK